ncbi:MAG: magnesium transporter [Gammaproteobacteria bacterium]|nr:magnesium transporter [Gammaproteobacteria bacterium]
MPETVVEQKRSQQRFEQVQKALNSGMFVHVRQMLMDMPACDTALLLESTPHKSRQIIWQLVDSDDQGEILEELSEDVQKSILKQMQAHQLAAAAEGMDTDDLTDVLRSLPDSIYQKVLATMDAQDRHRVEAAMAYDEDTAGSIMNTDTVTLRPDVNLDVVLRYLRLKGELPEATDMLYVVNKDDKLLGGVPLSTLITTNPSMTVAQIMDRTIEAIPADLEDTEVAQQFERHDWLSAPVVDGDGKLLGRITIDDVVDIIREDAEHSMMSLAGLDDEEDTFAPVIQSTYKRSVWLGINLLTALAAVSVSSLFEPILAQMAILAILNSIVPSMGGIAGNQTLTLIIRGMALGHIGDRNKRWLIGKEFAIGVLNGLIWALLLSVVVAWWQQDLKLGMVIAFAMLANMTAAGLAGVLIPLTLRRMNIDPALAGGVVLTTITDVVGIFAFLGTATLVYAA